MKSKIAAVLIISQIGLAPATGFSETVTPDAAVAPKSEAKPTPKEGLWINDKIKVSGQIRTRTELRHNLTATSPAAPGPLASDFSVLLRSRFGVEVVPTEHIGLNIQIQDSREFGEEAAAVPSAAGDDEGIDLHQGYIDLTKIADSNFNLRIGRQEIKLGNERLVGPVGWSNVGRSFDGILASYDPEHYKITAFATIADKITAPTIGDAQYFGGVYATWKDFPHGLLDGYYFILQDNNGAAGVAAGTGRVQSVHTFGAHLQAKYDTGFDYDVEAAFQTGKYGSNTILAHAEHVNLGYTFSPDWKPRLAIEYNYASGNDSSSRYTKFNNLFPTNHDKYGHIDIADWTNMHDLMVAFGTKPGKFSLGAEYHLLMVDKNHSTLDTFGATAGSATVGKIAGHEIDLIAKWALNKYFDVLGGYSHFIPGAYFKDRGNNSAANFFYVQAQAQF